MTSELTTDRLEKRELTTFNQPRVSGDERNFSPEPLDVSLIRTDGGTQPRARLELDVIDEYAKAMASGASFQPITVFYDGESYWLADGFHRLGAAKKIEALTIVAFIKQGTRRDAVLFSLSANATHGLRRTNADKRRAAITLLRDPEWSRWTNKAIADTCGVDEGLIRHLKSELSSDNPKIQNETFAKKCGVDASAVSEARTQVQSLPKELTARRNGKTYTVNTAQIGRSSTTAAPKEISGSTEAVSVTTLFESKPTAEDANNQVDDRELSYSIELGREETDLLEQKTEITSSSFAVSESPPAGTIAGTEENGLFTLVQSSENDEGELHLSQDCAQSTEDLDQICMKFCKYAGEMKDNHLETALQALASCIPLEQFVDFITDNQVEEVWQALAKRLLPDRIAKYLSQAQIEGLWQAIAPQIPAKSLSFYDWSTSELESFVQKAKWELEQRKQELSIKA